MSWDNEQATGSTIVATDWNDMVDYIKGINGEFIVSGTLDISTNVMASLIVNKNSTIQNVYARVRNAPGTDAIKIDIKKNGASILGSDLEIAASANTGLTANITDTALAINDYLDLEITQVGASGSEGDDLTVVIRC